MSTLTLDHLGALLAGVGPSPIPSVHKSLPVHMLSRPIDIYRVYLADILAKLPSCEVTLAYDAIQSPNTLPHGDLTLPIPRLRLKGKKSDDLCIDVASNFTDDYPLFQKPTARGIYLPIFFSPLPLPRLLLQYIFQRQDSYGRVPHMGLRNSFAAGLARKKVIVEFSSPNIAKDSLRDTYAAR